MTLEVGFRHLGYVGRDRDQEAVCDGMRAAFRGKDDSTGQRDNVFVTAKLCNSNHRERVKLAFDAATCPCRFPVSPMRIR